MNYTNLKGQQEQESLNTVVAPVHEIPHKQIICFWNITTNFKKLFEIIELAVDISTHLQRHGINN